MYRLFKRERRCCEALLFAVGVDAVALDHAVERAPIDAENLGGACAVTAGDLEYIKQISSFELVKHGKVFEESRQR